MKVFTRWGLFGKMKQFYETYADSELVSTVVTLKLHQLVELPSKDEVD